MGFLAGEPFSAAVAKRLLREILSTGEVFVSRHASTELRADGMTEQDAFNVLRAGDVDPAEWEKASWRYRVHTKKFCVVVAFVSETGAVIVTVWRKK